MVRLTKEIDFQPMRKRFKMKMLLISVNVLLLSSCAVLDYKPQIAGGGTNTDQRITLDLEQCKQLARQSISSSTGSDEQIPIKVRFKNAYDTCMIGRGHKVLRKVEAL